jgi:hypothetical protein
LFFECLPFAESYDDETQNTQETNAGLAILHQGDEYDGIANGDALLPVASPETNLASCTIFGSGYKKKRGAKYVNVRFKGQIWDFFGSRRQDAIAPGFGKR